MEWENYVQSTGQDILDLHTTLGLAFKMIGVPVQITQGYGTINIVVNAGDMHLNYVINTQKQYKEILSDPVSFIEKVQKDYQRITA